MGAISAGRRPSAVPAAASRWERRAQASCSSRRIPFSLAMRSAASPMVSPVEGSAMAGATGSRSRGRTRRNGEILEARLFARAASTKALARRREARMGTWESDSAPPATTTSACPDSMSRQASVMAWLAEVHARDTVYAGTSFGRVPSPTSRARLGACTSCTTVPSTRWPTVSGRTSLRASASRTAALPSSRAVSPARPVPDLWKGVRQPARMAVFMGRSCRARVGWRSQGARRRGPGLDARPFHRAGWSHIQPGMRASRRLPWRDASSSPPRRRAQ